MVFVVSPCPCFSEPTFLLKEAAIPLTVFRASAGQSVRQLSLACADASYCSTAAISLSVSPCASKAPQAFCPYSRASCND